MAFFGQTAILYAVVGIGVAGALYLSDPMGRRGERWFRIVSAIPFWPLYLPILLAHHRGEAHELALNAAVPVDEMAAAITQADTELEAALGSLDGWAENVLAREKKRIHELRSAWIAQAERLREMDRLLAQPEQAEMGNLPLHAGAEPSPAEERLRQSFLARRQNFMRLRRLRQRGFEDLMGTLAWVRELVSMIHLAKFTGAPAAQAEDLVAQIAAAVEGISESTWRMEEDAFLKKPHAQTSTEPAA